MKPTLSKTGKLPGGLNLWKKNNRWVLYAAFRNPAKGSEADRDSGVHGIRRPELLEQIWLALERAHDLLVAQGRNPLPESQQVPHLLQIYVYAVDDLEWSSFFPSGDPCTTQWISSPSRLGASMASFWVTTAMTLPSRSCEPLWESEFAQALSAAVHELSHSMNLQVLPFRRPGLKTPKSWIDSWQWLDEGMAVAAEADFEAEQKRCRQGDPRALAMASNWLRFALDWVDRPERSLDDPRHAYQAAFFVRYLRRLISNPKFLGEVWNLSRNLWFQCPEVDCSGLAMLASALRQETPSRILCSAPTRDVFASGYCLDSYFLNDPASPAHEPEVFARFKERAVTWTFSDENNPARSLQNSPVCSLPGLACRYFRIMPPKDQRTLEIRVLPAAGQSMGSLQHLKAEIAFATALPGSENGFARNQNLPIVTCDAPTTSVPLSCKVPAFTSSQCHHAVLVLTNCDHRPVEAGHSPLVGYRHKTEFSVERSLS